LPGGAVRAGAGAGRHHRQVAAARTGPVGRQPRALLHAANQRRPCGGGAGDAAAAGAGGAAAPGPARATRAGMTARRDDMGADMNQRLALCNEVLAPWDFARQCAYASELGYRGLEVAPFTLAEDPFTITD